MSIDPDILELIHADIDGVASERDHGRLQEAIARDPEVRKEYRRLRGLGDVLSRVPREEPPRGIAAAVMNRVRGRNVAAPAGFSSRLRWGWRAGPSALRYGYALAAGVVLGVLGVHILGGGAIGSSVRERDAAATLAPPARPAQLDLAGVGVHGVATLLPTPGGSSLQIELGGATPVELAVRFSPSKEGDRFEVFAVRDGERAPAGSLALPVKRN